MERRLISEADSRPLVVLDPRGPADPMRSTPPCAPPPRSPCTSPSARAARCCCRATGRAPVIEPDLLACPAVHVRLALLDDGRPVAGHRAEPPRPGRLRRRPPGRPRAARARRTPGGCLRRHPRRGWAGAGVLEVAGCRGYVSGRRRRCRRSRAARPRRRAGAASRGPRLGLRGLRSACDDAPHAAAGRPRGGPAADPDTHLLRARCAADRPRAPAWGPVHWMVDAQPPEPSGAWMA